MQEMAVVGQENRLAAVPSERPLAALPRNRKTMSDSFLFLSFPSLSTGSSFLCPTVKMAGTRFSDQEKKGKSLIHQALISRKERP